MKKRVLYGVLIAVLGANLLVGFQIYTAHAATKDDPYNYYSLFTRVIEMIRKDHVDGASLSYKDLVYAALRGMVGTLDPHSEFMEPQKFDELKKDTEGAFGGVGIVISVRDNWVTVVAPMEDTPGFRAGILAGDRIVKIDGKSTEKFNLNDVVMRLRGKPGTDVTVTIYRQSIGQEKEFTLTRAIIKVDTVKDINGRREFPLGEHDIGYVRLVQFGEQTASDLQEALKKLDKQGMKALILDLRNNPGGLLEQAVQVCEQFLPRGTLVVSTEGRDAAQNPKYHARGRDPRVDTPIVVLVNIGSASASEIVAGCLQDVKRGIVLGEQTFGKGSVQSILPMQDGSALRLTTAKYYTPAHKVIHEKGITPDIIVPMSDEEERALLLKRAPGGLDSLPEAEREKIKDLRDVQLDRAIDLLKGLNLFNARNGRTVEKVAAK